MGERSASATCSGPDKVQSVTLAAQFLDEIRAEFPAFRIVPKENSDFSKAIDVALRIVTLNGQRSFMTRYHTVIGDTLYVPPTWENMSDVDRVILLRHERVHLRQRRRYGFLPMAFLYLIPFFPLGLAYGRARIEWEAYVETLRATAENYGVAAVTQATFREHIVARFIGPDYGWMWPFRSSVERWYAEAVAELEQSFTRPSTGRRASTSEGTWQ